MSTSSKFSYFSSCSNFNPSISSISTVATGRQGAGGDENVQIVKKKQPDIPCFSMAFMMLMQIAITASVFYGIWNYLKHDQIISAAYFSAASQSFLGVILIVACCTCLQSTALNGIALMAVLLVALSEFVLVVYVSIMDELHQCNNAKDCAFYGDVQEKYTFVILHAVFSVVHGFFIGILCVRLSSSKSDEDEKKSAVASAQKLPPPQSVSQKQLQTHPIEKRSQSFHSSRASSASSSYRVPRHHRRTRSLSPSTRSIVSTKFPETSSMQSYIPPMQYPPQSTMSKCTIQHYPMVSNSCNIPHCPYYHPSQYQQQPSMTSQQNYQVVPYHPPPPQYSLPFYPNYSTTHDPSRSVVIDLPQRNDAAQNNVGGGNGGVIEIQRVIINVPQLYQNQVHQQQHQPLHSADRPQSQQPQENVYYKYVMPMSKK